MELIINELLETTERSKSRFKVNLVLLAYDIRLIRIILSIYGLKP